MRILTIKRKKSMIGCLGKIKIYIEDNENGNLVINGIKCSNLGELKNGQEKNFDIIENEVKIFAIWDKTS